MNAAVAIVLAIVLVAFSEVACYSGGAPSQACDNLTPSHGPQPQATSVPYSIDLAPLTGTSGGVGYTPGQTYTLTISGNAGENFRGFFIQTRTAADDSRVGTFTVTDSTNSRLSSCTPSTVGVTHRTGGEKTSVSFQWTAPSQGTGPIRFRFAVVEVMATFWADQASAIVQELVMVDPLTTTSAPDVTTGGDVTGGNPDTTGADADTTTMATAMVTGDVTNTTMGVTGGNNMPTTDGAMKQSSVGFVILILTVTTLLSVFM